MSKYVGSQLTQVLFIIVNVDQPLLLDPIYPSRHGGVYWLEINKECCEC